MVRLAGLRTWAAHTTCGETPVFCDGGGALGWPVSRTRRRQAPRFLSLRSLFFLGCSVVALARKLPCVTVLRDGETGRTVPLSRSYHCRDQPLSPLSPNVICQICLVWAKIPLFNLCLCMQLADACGYELMAALCIFMRPSVLIHMRAYQQHWPCACGHTFKQDFAELGSDASCFSLHFPRVSKPPGWLSELGTV